MFHGGWLIRRVMFGGIINLNLHLCTYEVIHMAKLFNLKLVIPDWWILF